MAHVIQRLWKSGPRKVKRTAWGFTAQLGGKQVRKFDAAWSKEDAANALAARLLGIETPKTSATAVVGLTLGEMTQKFLAEKRSEGKRSLKDDEERSRPLLAFFGKDATLTEITTRRVAEYRTARLVTKASRKETMLSPATVNRECALLRSILRMAVAWDELSRMPAFKMSREHGRERFLTVDEIARLLAACGDSRNVELHAMVTLALHTGLRKGELIELQWEQVDFSRGVLALGRHTKSGKPRDVPLNSAAYTALAPLRAAAGGVGAAGKVWRTRKVDTATTRPCAERRSLTRK